MFLTSAKRRLSQDHHYLDRPDVMSRFTTTVIAIVAGLSVLLSKRHRLPRLSTQASSLGYPGRPFPKPAYLFRLVAVTYVGFRTALPP